jgi:O-antigen/teichoic acid export membrane protein
MTGRLNPMVSTNTKRLNTAARIVKNSAFMFMVAVLSRGTGLIITALVARYLGPSALGTFAVVMGIALLFETTAPLGQRYVVIREVARDRSRVFTYWVNASLVTIVSSMALGIMLVLLTHLVGYDTTVLTSVYVVSLGLPLAGLYIIAQAVLQGMERMEYLTIAVLIGRLLDLLVLWVLLRTGMGVVAAFIGRGLFQLTAFLVLAWAILRQRGQHRTLRDWRPNLDLCRMTLRASSHFAIQNFLNIALPRVNTIILPMLVTLETVGMFSAADRVRQTGTMIFPMVTMAILPALSRTFATDREEFAALTESALKLLLIIVLSFASFVTIAADKITFLLYGPGYEAAVPVLQIVIWSQVFFVADSVLKRLMMATNNERPLVRRTGLSLGASIILTLFLAPRYGAPGAAWAAVLTRALNLGLDTQFVARNVLRVNLTDTVAKPLLCAALSGMVALVLRGQPLYTLLLLTAGSYVVLLLIFRVFSPDELLLLRRLSGRLWQRVAVWK